MPTIDDLRDALRDCERQAPEPAVVIDRVLSTPGHRRPAPILVAASALTVAAVAAGTVVLADRPGVHAGPHATTRTTSSSSASQSVVVSPPPSVALRWLFALAPRVGYTVGDRYWQPDQQTMQVQRTGRASETALITAYPKGDFDPARGGVDGGPLVGRSTEVHGLPATIGTQRNGDVVLAWQYAAGSWATVDADTAGAARRVADAVLFATDALIKLPFRVGYVPAGLQVVGVEATPGRRSFVMFGSGADGSADPVLTVLRGNLPQRRPDLASSDSVVRYLADGEILAVSSAPVHHAALSHAELVRIAASVDLSPSSTDSATWLPVPR